MGGQHVDVGRPSIDVGDRPLMLGGPHGVVGKQPDDVAGLPIDGGTAPR